MPAFTAICKKCYLPLRWDANRRVWVTSTGSVGCKKGGLHVGVKN